MSPADPIRKPVAPPAVYFDSGPLRPRLSSGHDQIGVDDPGRRVGIPLGAQTFDGYLTLPRRGARTVVLVHASCDSRFSRRNHRLAQALRRDGLGTLVVDLLTPHDAERFGEAQRLQLLVDRLVGVTRWLPQSAATSRGGVGYFGSRLGAVAAYTAASQLEKRVGGVCAVGVSPRAGLAGAIAAQGGGGATPLLFIVGATDPRAGDHGPTAGAPLTEASEIALVPNAGPLFESLEALDTVGAVAASWLGKRLGNRDPRRLPPPEEPPGHEEGAGTC